MTYFNAYNTNSTGLHTFTDQNDSNQYLYSQFEAHHFHRVFPGFDQPDMKAKMTLMATVPAEWVAVSNAKEIRWEDAQKDGYRVMERNEFMDFLNCYPAG